MTNRWLKHARRLPLEMTEVQARNWAFSWHETHSATLPATMLAMSACFDEQIAPSD
jgi:hypothetical protein